MNKSTNTGLGWWNQATGGFLMNRFWWRVWKQEWIPLGRLAPYVLGWALRSKPKRIKND